MRRLQARWLVLEKKVVLRWEQTAQQVPLNRRWWPELPEWQAEGWRWLRSFPHRTTRATDWPCLRLIPPVGKVGSAEHSCWEVRCQDWQEVGSPFVQEWSWQVL